MGRAVSVDVSPTAGVKLGGYLGRNSVSTGLHMPLEVNIVQISSNTNSVVWVAIDALAVNSKMRQAVVTALTSLGVSEENVVVVATHTHSAPASWAGTIHPVLPAEFSEAEAERIARLVATSLGSVRSQPIRLEVGQSEVTAVGTNRHDPSVQTDQSLQAVRVSARGGAPVAVIFDYACHPTVLGPDSLLCSPDWVGGTRQLLRERTLADLPVVFLPGASGDVSTRFTRREASPAEAERLGTLVGMSVLEALLEPEPADSSAVGIVRGTVLANTRRDFNDVAPPLLNEDDPLTNDRLTASFVEGVASQNAYLEARVQACMSIPYSIVNIGQWWWLNTPFEIGTGLSTRLLHGNPNSRFVGYADGYCGYLATRHQARAGHYEAQASFFDLRTTEQIITDIALAVDKTYKRGSVADA